VPPRVKVLLVLKQKPRFRCIWALWALIYGLDVVPRIDAVCDSGLLPPVGSNERRSPVRPQWFPICRRPTDTTATTPRTAAIHPVPGWPRRASGSTVTTDRRAPEPFAFVGGVAAVRAVTNWSAAKTRLGRRWRGETPGRSGALVGGVWMRGVRNRDGNAADRGAPGWLRPAAASASAAARSIDGPAVRPPRPPASAQNRITPTARRNRDGSTDRAAVGRVEPPFRARPAASLSRVMRKWQTVCRSSESLANVTRKVAIDREIGKLCVNESLNQIQFTEQNHERETSMRRKPYLRLWMLHLQVCNAAV